MKITRTSQLSGKERTLDLDVTEEQLQNYKDGAMLQDAFHSLPIAEREFIKSGITGEEWNKQFGF